MNTPSPIGCRMHRNEDKTFYVEITQDFTLIFEADARSLKNAVEIGLKKGATIFGIFSHDELERTFDAANAETFISV